MDIQRIRAEVVQAAISFAWLEVRATTDGQGVFVKAAMQTTMSNVYALVINFPNYPHQMPKVAVSQPTLRPSPHKYNDDTICYLHPSLWNPGVHNLTFVLARAAKWLNKYEVYCAKGKWPGAQMKH
jgi:ubiquitin-protein ligase